MGERRRATPRDVAAKPRAAPALLRFSGAVECDPAIDAWFDRHPPELGTIARRWFARMRRCGGDVRELIHDGCPVACVEDAPFGYVNAFRAHVNVGFFQGASLADPARQLEGNGKFMRHLKLRPGQGLDAAALEALIVAAHRDIRMRLRSSLRDGSRSERAAATRAIDRSAEGMPAATATKPVLLAGGNPQIAKADGDAPVQAYVAAMPGWKRDVGRRLDALIVRTVPGVRKAVKWNSPFYGVAGRGWFLSFHCCTRFVKVAFFRGTALRPPPPGESKQKDVRYLDIHEHDALDEAQLADWVAQASRLPGWGGIS